MNAFKKMKENTYAPPEENEKRSNLFS